MSSVSDPSRFARMSALSVDSGLHSFARELMHGAILLQARSLSENRMPFVTVSALARGVGGMNCDGKDVTTLAVFTQVLFHSYQI